MPDSFKAIMGTSIPEQSVPTVMLDASDVEGDGLIVLPSRIKKFACSAQLLSKSYASR